jgi:NAD(P)-dependent dehydrogenase (short-subunit alcohol dehydrogenase family)
MKTIIITGGTSGIGLELVNYFANKDYEVIFTGRNEQKANQIIANNPKAKLNFFKVDFASLKDVAETAECIISQFQKIDVLINNAGVWEMEFKETRDGIETNFAVNHLATMLFTLTLLPSINPEGGRIVNTSSGAHKRNILDFNDIEFRKQTYDGVLTYSQSKLCNILFTKRLAHELENKKISVNTVHPGYVKTGLFQNMGQRSWENVSNAFEGARSAIFAAENESIKQSNLYIYQENIDPNLSTAAQNQHNANKLWDLSMTYLKHHLQKSAV